MQTSPGCGRDVTERDNTSTLVASRSPAEQQSPVGATAHSANTASVDTGMRWRHGTSQRQSASRDDKQPSQLAPRRRRPAALRFLPGATAGVLSRPQQSPLLPASPQWEFAGVGSATGDAGGAAAHQVRAGGWESRRGPRTSANGSTSPRSALSRGRRWGGSLRDVYSRTTHASTKSLSGVSSSSQAQTASAAGPDPDASGAAQAHPSQHASAGATESAAAAKPWNQVWSRSTPTGGGQDNTPSPLLLTNQGTVATAAASKPVVQVDVASPARCSPVMFRADPPTVAIPRASPTSRFVARSPSGAPVSPTVSAGYRRPATAAAVQARARHSARLAGREVVQSPGSRLGRLRRSGAGGMAPAKQASPTGVQPAARQHQWASHDSQRSKDPGTKSGTTDEPGASASASRPATASNGDQRSPSRRKNAQAQRGSPKAGRSRRVARPRMLARRPRSVSSLAKASASTATASPRAIPPVALACHHRLQSRPHTAANHAPKRTRTNSDVSDTSRPGTPNTAGSRTTGPHKRSPARAPGDKSGCDRGWVGSGWLSSSVRDKREATGGRQGRRSAAQAAPVATSGRRHAQASADGMLLTNRASIARRLAAGVGVAVSGHKRLSSVGAVSLPNLHVVHRHPNQVPRVVGQGLYYSRSLRDMFSHWPRRTCDRTRSSSTTIRGQVLCC